VARFLIRQIFDDLAPGVELARTCDLDKRVGEKSSYLIRRVTDGRFEESLFESNEICWFHHHVAICLLACFAG
jgi:hypothetical protein